MAKNYKIKRNQKIYSKSKFSFGKILKTFLIIVLCAGLVLIGFSVAGPLVNFFSGNVEPSSSPSYSYTTPTTSDSATTGQSSVSQSTQPEPTPLESIQGATLSHTVLADPTALENFITQAKQNDINSVVVTMKDAQGYLLFSTDNPEITKFGTVATTAVDVSVGLKTLAENDITIVAQVHAFLDSSASLIAGELNRNRGSTHIIPTHRVI